MTSGHDPDVLKRFDTNLHVLWSSSLVDQFLIQSGLGLKSNLLVFLFLLEGVGIGFYFSFTSFLVDTHFAHLMSDIEKQIEGLHYNRSKYIIPMTLKFIEFSIVFLVMFSSPPLGRISLLSHLSQHLYAYFYLSHCHFNQLHVCLPPDTLGAETESFSSLYFSKTYPA